MRANRTQRLPFLASVFGTWWGSDARTHEQADIDVIAADNTRQNIVLGECKWRNQFNVTQTINLLRSRAALLPGYSTHHFMLFTKTSEMAEIARQHSESDCTAMSVDEMFAEVNRS